MKRDDDDEGTAVELSEGIVDHRGSRLHYWITGPRGAPLICCSHGASMDHHMFDAQLPRLVDAGYRVLAWDMPGHGISGPISYDFSVQAAAEGLHALIEHMGYDRATLLGQSFGGYVSQELHYTHPELVDALVIIGSTSLTYPMSRWNRFALRLSPALFMLWPNRSRITLVGRNTATTQDAQEYAHDATERLSKREFVTVWRAVARGMRKDPGFRIRCPLLLTHGSEDRVGIVAGAAAEWARREPGCRYVVIPRAGHNANQDNPEYFNSVLLDFLGEYVTVR